MAVADLKRSLTQARRLLENTLTQDFFNNLKGASITFGFYQTVMDSSIVLRIVRFVPNAWLQAVMEFDQPALNASESSSLQAMATFLRIRRLIDIANRFGLLMLFKGPDICPLTARSS
jgi:hypothetical protein